MIPITNLIEQLPWHPNRRWSKRSLNRIDKIIVHQELGEGTVEQVNNYHITAPNHISSKGCPHICYHYCIRKDGEVVQANDLSSITWHCKGENSTAIGIMLVGNFNGPGYSLGTSEPTEAQKTSLKGLVDHLLSGFSLTKQDVYGHYHFGKPECPGYTIQEWVEATRNEIIETIAANNIPMETKEVQKRLNQLGYGVGKVDGIHGIRTASAIRKFQTDSGLHVDGVVGPSTWKTLIAKTT